MKTRIKEIRNKKNISQVQLAELLGITQPSLAAIESGKRVPKLETLMRIAAALDTSVLSLLPSEISEGSIIPSPEDRELLEAVSDLNDSGRKKVREYAADLGNNPNYRK